MPSPRAIRKDLLLSKKSNGSELFCVTRTFLFTSISTRICRLKVWISSVPSCFSFGHFVLSLFSVFTPVHSTCDAARRSVPTNVRLGSKFFLFSEAFFSTAFKKDYHLAFRLKAARSSVFSPAPLWVLCNSYVALAMYIGAGIINYPVECCHKLLMQSNYSF